MKLIGHAWIAINARPQGNQKLLMFGSIIPEVMYYVSDSPFSFEEIHEGGDRLYEYLRLNNLELSDLGLGMLSHSVKAGADRFNMDDNLEILGFKASDIIILRKQLSGVLGIDYPTTKARVHNILELAVELRIIREHPAFIKKLTSTIADKEINRKAIDALAACFNKSPNKVKKSVNELIEKAKPDYFVGADGLANLWHEFIRDIDPAPDHHALVKLLENLSSQFGTKDSLFINECIVWTKSNLDKITCGD